MNNTKTSTNWLWVSCPTASGQRRLFKWCWLAFSITHNPTTSRLAIHENDHISCPLSFSQLQQLCRTDHQIYRESALPWRSCPSTPHTAWVCCSSRTHTSTLAVVSRCTAVCVDQYQTSWHRILSNTIPFTSHAPHPTPHMNARRRDCI